jgi:UDPglucose 6-dehydrogenase
MSTVPPGTARNIIKPILEKESRKRKGEGFNLCSNPELFRQGEAIRDTENPDRIIIGGDEPDTARLEQFYREFLADRRCVTLCTTHENAELIKYANSAFIANKISFINFIADVAEKVCSADVRVIAEGIGLDQRIGPGALNAGIGWGGPCLPKDARALIEFSRGCGVEPDLMRAVAAVNDAHHQKVIKLAKETMGSLKGRRISLLGLAFKSGTDELKDASSTVIIKKLLAEGAEVVVYDPKSASHARKALGNIVEYADNAFACIEQADCCVIVTEWDEFKQIPPETFRRKMRQPIVIDGRGIYKADAFSQAGVRLLNIGVGPTA